MQDDKPLKDFCDIMKKAAVECDARECECFLFCLANQSKLDEEATGIACAVDALTEHLAE